MKEKKKDLGKRVERGVDSELGERWRVTESGGGGEGGVGSCVVNCDSGRYCQSWKGGSRIGEKWRVVSSELRERWKLCITSWVRDGELWKGIVRWVGNHGG